jgi:hypothetical protein
MLRPRSTLPTCWLPLAAVGAASLVVASLVGCGSTRTSNTMRTATEQMLISDAIDRTVDSIDFTPLAGQSVYFDDGKLEEVVDKGYLVSSLRQHMLASGCVLKDDRDEATFVVEPRAGVVGTDNHDLLFGVPAFQMPQVAAATAAPAAIPEIPFAKRRDQRGVAKVAVFAYRRDTGEPVWQSGIVVNTSTANDIWVLGAGPFQRGSIYNREEFSGKKLVGTDPIELPRLLPTNVASVDDEAMFEGLNKGPAAIAKAPVSGPYDPEVIPAAAWSDLPPAPLADGAAAYPPPRPISEAPRPE